MRSFRTSVTVLAAWLALVGDPVSGRAAPAVHPDLIGETGRYTTRAPDTFIDIARRFGLGYVELAIANRGVDPWLPGAGVALTIPRAHLLPDAPHEGIVINLAEQRLYFFPPRGGPVESYPIGIGVQGWETPLGRTKVTGKRVRPTWYVPASIRKQDPTLPAAVPPGPDNPLGSHALDLGWASYVIHGTNKPAGIGRRVSHGCIRLYPEDIAALFARVPVGTPVTVVDQPVKLGWSGGRLYLEVHPTQGQADEFEESGAFAPRPIADLARRIRDAAKDRADAVDWAAVSRAATARDGVPTPITGP